MELQLIDCHYLLSSVPSVLLHTFVVNGVAISLTCLEKPSCSAEMVHNDCWVVIILIVCIASQIECFFYDLASYLDSEVR